MRGIHAVAMMVGCALLLVSVWGLFANKACALETIQVIKIDAQGHSALIRTAAGTLRVIHAGEPVAPYGNVEMIDKDRIVIRNKKLEKIILTLHNGRQIIQRTGKIDAASRHPIISVTSTTGVGDNAAQTGQGRLLEVPKKESK
jgi:hypothetical protein